VKGQRAKGAKTSADSPGRRASHYEAQLHEVYFALSASKFMSGSGNRRELEITDYLPTEVKLSAQSSRHSAKRVVIGA
jgi:hypothetical protein